MNFAGYLISILFIALIPNAAYSAPQCQIEDYGVFMMGKYLGSRKSDDSLHDQVLSFKGNKITERTTKIIAKRGTRFGVKHIFHGIPERTYVRLILKHPKITRPDGKVIEKQSAKKNPSSLETHYGFDHDYELVNGKWIFEFWYKDKLLCSKEFISYVPNDS